MARFFYVIAFERYEFRFITNSSYEHISGLIHSSSKHKTYPAPLITVITFLVQQSTKTRKSFPTCVIVSIIFCFSKTTQSPHRLISFSGFSIFYSDFHLALFYSSARVCFSIPSVFFSLLVFKPSMRLFYTTALLFYRGLFV